MAAQGFGPGRRLADYESHDLYLKLVDAATLIPKAAYCSFDEFVRESETRLTQAEMLAVCLFGGRVTRQNIECLLLATQLSAPAAALMIERVQAVTARSQPIQERKT